MKKVCCLLMLLVAITPRLAAQSTPETEAVVLTENQNDVVTQIFGKNKLALMSETLNLSPIEEKAFEVTLIDYEAEKEPWLSERLALLKMYNEEFSSVDERKMNSLTRQMINNDLEFTRLQLRYFRRMNKLLGANRAAKFFQLDSYIEQSTRSHIQNQLPFIKELELDKRDGRPLTRR
ncbi:hypothetical protein SAMN05660909_04066 [Chitinophaga terrae (ex Kim and Jung 2007)]|jgi:hypothetical protein|uniref:Uncharacterized protein n=1 Tax=Chitinophaga terrae (ex Kim and Jung 2007) TaxID=408074 RepID=A0A1H4EZR7_9BACT|nr:hypothetical protein [Chitinophaga terrae (ex Kim and Jung 2007)]MDQ0109925.1 hypothetical protein [Chitinophaga terrae (ex Kim and Jung 2007)]SEA90401.1 hypothetical protein SAMN05660909_04066 [Chitinophaga terrae (ex Kim and Jung 2007)]